MCALDSKVDETKMRGYQSSPSCHFIPKVVTFVLVATAMSVSLAAGSSAPASARVTKRVTVRSMSEGEQGWALPPVYLMVCGRLQIFLSPGTWDNRSRITWNDMIVRGK